MATNVLNDLQSGRRSFSGKTLLMAIVLCVYWTALFYGTHSKVPPGLLPGRSDKVIHAVSYAGLGFFLILLRAIHGNLTWKSVGLRWIVLAVYGAFDEITQIPFNRTADLYDWYADILGAAFGLLAATLMFRWFRRLPRSELQRVNAVTDG